MRKILTAVIAVTMLVPSMTLASSFRPGSVPRPRTKTPLCLDAESKFTEKCEIVIDETGNGNKTEAIKTTLSTLLSDNYQEKASVLGYVPLRGDILQKSRDAVERIGK